MSTIIKWGLTVAPFLYMALIWYMSGNPDDMIIKMKHDQFDRIFKESLHLVEFAILYVLFILALLAHGRLTYTASVIAAIVAGFYGLTDEIHQSFVPYRSATLIDAVKDLTGVAVCLVIVNRTYFKDKTHPVTRGMEWLQAKLTDI
ncbi:VanZ family protein [Bacillus sp. SCS-153A]|uniref:VanZ family protein n=1 Tax=Rossellomorea sedimentorum TaxID=3115294 RepID=UPI0039063C23